MFYVLCVHSSFAIIVMGKRELVALLCVFFLVFYDCCVALPRGATALFAVCDFGISKSYSLVLADTHFVITHRLFRTEETVRIEIVFDRNDATDSIKSMGRARRLTNDMRLEVKVIIKPSQYQDCGGKYTQRQTLGTTDFIAKCFRAWLCDVYQTYHL